MKKLSKDYLDGFIRSADLVLERIDAGLLRSASDVRQYVIGLRYTMKSELDSRTPKKSAKQLKR